LVFDGEVLVAEEHVGEEVFGYPVVEKEEEDGCGEGDRDSPSFPGFAFRVWFHGFLFSAGQIMGVGFLRPMAIVMTLDRHKIEGKPDGTVAITAYHFAMRSLGICI
jgi:hypothetical protein